MTKLLKPKLRQKVLKFKMKTKNITIKLIQNIHTFYNSNSK